MARTKGAGARVLVAILGVAVLWKTAGLLSSAFAVEQTGDIFDFPDLVIIFLPILFFGTLYQEWESQQIDADQITGAGQTSGVTDYTGLTGLQYGKGDQGVITSGISNYTPLEGEKTPI